MVVAERENVLAPDLDKYRGLWVAIVDGRVVAASMNAVDLFRDLRERGIEDAELHHVAEEPNAAFVL